MVECRDKIEFKQRGFLNVIWFGLSEGWCVIKKFNIFHARALTSVARSEPLY